MFIASYLAVTYHVIVLLYYNSYYIYIYKISFERAVAVCHAVSGMDPETHGMASCRYGVINLAMHACTQSGW